MKKAIVSYISLIISLIVLAISAYLFKNDRQIKQQLQAQNIRLEENSKAIAKLQSDLQNQSSAKTPPSSLQSSVANLIKGAVEEKIPAQNNQHDHNNNHKPQGETPEFFINLAMSQYILTQDAEKTIHFLEIAQQQLLKNTDTQSIKMQTAIKKDILILKELDLPNTEEIWLELGLLSDRIADLPLKSVPNAQKQSETETPAEEGWQENLKKSWGDLKGLIKIRTHNKPLEPLLEASEERMIREELNLLLLQARVALLLKKQLMFQEAMKETISWVEHYFDNDDKSVQKMIDDLKELEAMEIAKPMPNLEIWQLMSESRSR